METKVRTPHEVLFMPQRLLVPLFQPPYVWTRENQWTMLWDDIRRHAELKPRRRLERGGGRRDR